MVIVRSGEKSNGRRTVANLSHFPERNKNCKKKGEI